MKVVHFVCSGNTYRSRLAEAYFNSKKIPGWKAISSGIHADRDLHGPISWYTLTLCREHGLEKFLSPGWRQTCKEDLEKSDRIVCMEEKHKDYVVELLEKTVVAIEIWGIEDMPSSLDEKASMAQAEATFSAISSKIDSVFVV